MLDTLLVVSILENIAVDARGREVMDYLHQQKIKARYRNAAARYITLWLHYQFFGKRSTSSKKMAIRSSASSTPITQTMRASLRGHYTMSDIIRALEAFKHQQRSLQVTTSIVQDPIIDRLNSLQVGIIKLWSHLKGETHHVPLPIKKSSVLLPELSSLPSPDNTNFDPEMEKRLRAIEKTKHPCWPKMLA